MVISDKFYDKCLSELKTLIPQDEAIKLMAQDYCELESDFLGFVDVYKPLSEIIPKHMTIIDFGCYMAAQSYFFKDHCKYIGVDICELKRFQPPNAEHYCMTIQDYIKTEVPLLFEKQENMMYYAICSYVPDKEATRLVRETFQNVCCYYPCGSLNAYAKQLEEQDY